MVDAVEAAAGAEVGLVHGADDRLAPEEIGIHRDFVKHQGASARGVGFAERDVADCGKVAAHEAEAARLHCIFKFFDIHGIFSLNLNVVDSEAEAHFSGVHDVVRVELLFELVEDKRLRGTVEFLHETAELESDSVMFVDHSAVGDGGADREVPDSVVEIGGFSRIGGRLFKMKRA